MLIVFKGRLFVWNAKVYFLEKNESKYFKMSSADFFTQHAKR